MRHSSLPFQMLRPFFLFASIAAVGVIACRRGAPESGPDGRGNAPGISERDARARANAVRLEPYQSVDHAFRDAKSHLPHSVRLTVQDSADWRTVWARIAGPNAAAEPPAVDFTREMLLVAGMGEQPCMGYLINIDTIFRDDDRRIYAVVRERHRGAGCGCLNEVVSPVDVVRVPRTIRPVTFLERRESNVCEVR
jgi:hypothetical protein